MRAKNAILLVRFAFKQRRKQDGGVVPPPEGRVEALLNNLPRSGGRGDDE